VSHGVLAAVFTVVWAVAFVVAVDRDVLYPVVGAVAAIAIAVVVWRHGALRQELLAGPRVALNPQAGASNDVANVANVANGANVAIDVVAGVVIGVVLVAGTHLGFRLLVSAFPSLGDDVARLYAVAAVTPARLAFVLLIGAAEEVVWRGLTLDVLRRRWPTRPAAAIVVAAVVYAAAQMGPRSPWLLVAGVALGIVWGLMRLRRSLWMPIASHLVWTVSILGVAPLPLVTSPG
jgi:membrane protease YdiL (CAAX protease family)